MDKTNVMKLVLIQELIFLASLKFNKKFKIELRPFKFAQSKFTAISTRSVKYSFSNESNRQLNSSYFDFSKDDS